MVTGRRVAETSMPGICRAAPWICSSSRAASATRLATAAPHPDRDCEGPNHNQSCSARVFRAIQEWNQLVCGGEQNYGQSAAQNGLAGTPTWKAAANVARSFSAQRHSFAARNFT